MLLEMNRGSIGVLVDVASCGLNETKHFLTVPVVENVKLGVQYGQQGNELTGNYVGAGGTQVFVLSD